MASPGLTGFPTRVPVGGLGSAAVAAVHMAAWTDVQRCPSPGFGFPGLQVLRVGGVRSWAPISIAIS